MYCSVAGCVNGTALGKKHHAVRHTIFHRPRNGPEAVSWLRAIGRSGKTDSKRLFVCSEHFLLEDYEGDHKFEVENPDKGILDNPKRRLEAGVIPSQNIPGYYSIERVANPGRERRASDGHDTSGDSDDNSRCADRRPSARHDTADRQLRVMIQLQRQRFVLERRLAESRRQLNETLRQRAWLHGARDQSTDDDWKWLDDMLASLPSYDNENETGDNPLLVLRDNMKHHVLDLPPENDMTTMPFSLTEAKRVIFNLRLEVLALRNRVLKHAQDANVQTIDTLVKMGANVAKSASETRRLRAALSLVFTSAQTSRLVPGDRTIRWGAEDFQRSISLRRLCCSRTFDFVRTKMKIPLPSMLAVNRTAESGHLPEITKLYRELEERKNLQLNRSVKVKSDQSDSGATGATDPNKKQATSPSGRGTGTGRGLKRNLKKESAHAEGEARRKRKKIGSESSPVQVRSRVAPRKPCWQTLGGGKGLESKVSDAEMLDHPSPQVGVGSPVWGRGRSHARDMGQQRTEPTKHMAIWSGGGRGRRGVGVSPQMRARLCRAQPVPDDGNGSDRSRPASEDRRQTRRLASRRRAATLGRGRNGVRFVTVDGVECHRGRRERKREHAGSTRAMAAAV